MVVYQDNYDLIIPKNSILATERCIKTRTNAQKSEVDKLSNTEEFESEETSEEKDSGPGYI